MITYIDTIQRQKLAQNSLQMRVISDEGRNRELKMKRFQNVTISPKIYETRQADAY